MSSHDSRVPNRPVPRCMRITESPIELSSPAVLLLLAQLQGRHGSGTTVGESELQSFALHTWRLGRRVDGMAESEGRVKRQLQDSHRRLVDALADLGVTIEDPTEQAYTDGWLEVDVIAWEEPDGPTPDGITGPWVKQTIRPLIRKGDGLLCKGEVVLADPGHDHQSEQLDKERQL